MNKVAYCCLVICLVISCTKSKGIILSDETRENQISLVSSDKITFILDSVTINRINCLEYSDLTDELSFYNKYDHSILLYDYESKKYKKRINVPLELPQLQGYSLQNPDSLLFHSYLTSTTYLMDNQLKLVKAIVWDDRHREKDIFLPSPYVGTSTPIRSINGNIVMIGMIAGETTKENEYNRPVLSIYNSIDGKRFSLSYPQHYSLFNWGGGLFYRLPYYTTTCDKDKILISFPASHDLYSYDLSDGEIEIYYGGSNEIIEITSFPFRKNKIVSSNLEREWYMNNPSFEGIYYDKYKELYYRIARLPQSDFHNSKENLKPTIIIIFDNNLNYLGEYHLPEHMIYVPSNSFVTKEGLNIQILTENEDELSFMQYSFQNNTSDYRNNSAI